MAKPLWINKDAVSGQPVLDATEMRQVMALPLMYGGRNLGARQGVRPGGNQFEVSLAGSVITVQPGLCCIDPGLTTTQGPYWVAIPAAENPVGGPLAAADASNPRKDIVVGRVYDHDADNSGLRLARSEYVAGVAGPAPAEPQVPAGAFRLATIDVPRAGNGAPAVTNNFPYTVAAGGILPVRAAGDIVAGVEGRYRDRLDTNVLERDNGSAWETVADPAVFRPWTDWSASFAIRATVTNPTMGNSVVKARYCMIGKTIEYNFWINIGSTFSPGSGNYRFPLPIAGRAADFAYMNGSATVLDNLTAQRCATLYSITPTLLEIMLTANSAVLTSAGSGTSWAAGDVISGYITYEAA